MQGSQVEVHMDTVAPGSGAGPGPGPKTSELGKESSASKQRGETLVGYFNTSQRAVGFQLFKHQ